VAIYAKLLETPLDEHERLFRTNYFGAVNGAAAAVPHLREAGGALITVGSIVSDLPAPIMGAYSASKHAVKGFIQSLRIELAADKLPISVTLIKPAGVDTPVAEHAANHGPGEALLPPPVVDPERVAAAILDAAVHPRREVTVGVAGRAQVLLGTQFPALFERIAPALMPLLFDPTRRKTPGSNLFRPGADGEERAEGPPSAPSALVARSGPLLPTAMLAGSAMALVAGIAAWRRRAPSPT
jgi:short-subunit dehydrogenase